MQDTFLPHIEDGTITFIGATTENPSFQINNALMSRCRVIILEKLSVENIECILERALQELGVKVKDAESER
jgi:putative ATPase